MRLLLPLLSCFLVVGDLLTTVHAETDVSWQQSFTTPTTTMDGPVCNSKHRHNVKRITDWYSILIVNWHSYASQERYCLAIGMALMRTPAALPSMGLLSSHSNGSLGMAQATNSLSTVYGKYLVAVLSSWTHIFSSFVGLIIGRFLNRMIGTEVMDRRSYFLYNSNGSRAPRRGCDKTRISKSIGPIIKSMNPELHQQMARLWPSYKGDNNW